MRSLLRNVHSRPRRAEHADELLASMRKLLNEIRGKKQAKVRAKLSVWRREFSAKVLPELKKPR
jgi:hypothetical protein